MYFNSLVGMKSSSDINTVHFEHSEGERGGFEKKFISGSIFKMCLETTITLDVKWMVICLHHEYFMVKYTAWYHAQAIYLPDRVDMTQSVLSISKNVRTFRS